MFRFGRDGPHRRRWPVRIAGVSLFGLALWTAGLVRFAGQIPSGVDDPISRTDAIVVLTGGSERLATGLQLLAEGRAGKLFVSGVHRGVDVSQLLRVARRAPRELDCCIVLGHDADARQNGRDRQKRLSGLPSNLQRTVSLFGICRIYQSICKAFHNIGYASPNVGAARMPLRAVSGP